VSFRFLDFSAASIEIAFERNIPSDFSDRDRRDLYIRGRADRGAADRAVRPSSEAQTE